MDGSSCAMTPEDEDTGEELPRPLPRRLPLPPLFADGSRPALRIAAVSCFQAGPCALRSTMQPSPALSRFVERSRSTRPMSRSPTLLTPDAAPASAASLDPSESPPVPACGDASALLPPPPPPPAPLDDPSSSSSSSSSPPPPQRLLDLPPLLPSPADERRRSPLFGLTGSRMDPVTPSRPPIAAGAS